MNRIHKKFIVLFVWFILVGCGPNSDIIKDDQSNIATPYDLDETSNPRNSEQGQNIDWQHLYFGDGQVPIVTFDANNNPIVAFTRMFCQASTPYTLPFYCAKSGLFSFHWSGDSWNEYFYPFTADENFELLAVKQIDEEGPLFVLSNIAEDDSLEMYLGRYENETFVIEHHDLGYGHLRNLGTVQIDEDGVIHIVQREEPGILSYVNYEPTSRSVHFDSFRANTPQEAIGMTVDSTGQPYFVHRLYQSREEGSDPYEPLPLAFTTLNSYNRFTTNIVDENVVSFSRRSIHYRHGIYGEYIHIIYSRWNETENMYELCLAYKEPRSDTFTIEVLDTSPYIHFEQALSVDEQNRAHIIYNNNYQLFYNVFDTTTPPILSEPMLINGEAGNYVESSSWHYIALKPESNEIPHIAFTKQFPADYSLLDEQGGISMVNFITPYGDFLSRTELPDFSPTVQPLQCTNHRFVALGIDCDGAKKVLFSENEDQIMSESWSLEDWVSCGPYYPYNLTEASESTMLYAWFSDTNDEIIDIVPTNVRIPNCNMPDLIIRSAEFYRGRGNYLYVVIENLAPEGSMGSSVYGPISIGVKPNWYTKPGYNSTKLVLRSDEFIEPGYGISTVIYVPSASSHTIKVDPTDVIVERDENNNIFELAMPEKSGI